jgi:hypothetical protein
VGDDMARPKLDEPKKQYTVMLRESTVKDIDCIAEKFGFSRSLFMATLVEGCLADLMKSEQLGEVKAVKIGDRVINKFKNVTYGNSGNSGINS